MSSVEATPLEEVRLIQTAVDTWSISGCLTFETVGRLVAGMRRARIAQYQVHWREVPEVVLRLIRVMGVGDLLVSRSGG